MTPQESFSNYYKSVNNSELLETLQNQHEYEPLAVIAAKAEFDDRNLSEEEIDDARQPLLLQQLQETNRKARVKQLQAGVKNIGNALSDSFIPDTTGSLSAGKLVKLITVGFSVVFIYQTIRFLPYVFSTGSYGRFELQIVLYLHPVMILLIGIITFWRRKQIGWIALVSFSVYSLIGSIALFLLALKMRSSDAQLLRRIYSGPPTLPHLFGAIILGGTIYVLCKAPLRDMYSIDRRRMRATIIISGIYSVLVMLLS